jgi:response regulator RpfG family c-di-GMP phosphodiesterase
LTTTSPAEAIKIAQAEDVWAVVSDFKMPLISGTDFLSRLRKIAPLATRMMLTGYLEIAIVQEAINLAGVFRFVTKPWDEVELKFAVESALQHSRRQRENQILLQEVTQQNNLLENLTKNLENEVLLRTRGIEESKVQAEEKERRVRELTGFVKELSYVTELEDLYRLLEQDAFHFPSLSAPLLLAVRAENQGVLYWGRESNLREKPVTQLPGTLKD